MKDKELKLDEIEAQKPLSHYVERGKVLCSGEGSGEGVDGTRSQIHNDTSISQAVILAVVL